jgi:FHA domain
VESETQIHPGVIEMKYGSSQLLIAGDRFAFLTQPLLNVATAQALVGHTDELIPVGVVDENNDDLFLRRVLALWMTHPATGVVAGVVSDDLVVVVGGSGSLTVTVDGVPQPVDARGRATINERHFPAWDSFQIGSDDQPDAVLVSPAFLLALTDGLRITRQSTTTSPQLIDGLVSGMTMKPLVVAKVVADCESDPAAKAIERELVFGMPAHLLPEVVAVPPVAVLPVAVPPLVVQPAVMDHRALPEPLPGGPILSPEDTDYELGLTIWPVSGLATREAIDPVVVVEDLPPIANRVPPLVEQLHQSVIPEVLPESDIEFPVPTGLTSQPSPSESSSEDQSTLTWNTGGYSAGVDDDLDAVEMTMFASDLPGYRSSPIRIAATTERRQEVITGAYCRSGHFTDSGAPACLFCGSEVDLSTFGQGERPLMAVLEFSDGRTVPLTRPVVVGRKLSGKLAHDSEFVAFPDDLKLSRQHVEIKVADWTVVVVDQQSANGTTIVAPNGRSSAARPNFETVVDIGTSVRCGDVSFTLQRPSS